MTDTPQPTSVSLSVEEVPVGGLKQITLNGTKVCVANVDGTLYALSDTCTHANIPMSSGALDGHELICPWHGAGFDVRSGAVTCGPAVEPLRCYNVTIEGDTATIEEKN